VPFPVRAIPELWHSRIAPFLSSGFREYDRFQVPGWAGRLDALGGTAEAAVPTRKVLCSSDVIVRFLGPPGERMQDHWRGEHGGGEEQISFNGAAEEWQAGNVASHQSGEGHWV